MPVTLQKELRTQLARTTLEARSKAEAAARAALENLAVHEAAPRSHMNEEQRKLRNRLRARGRALGDTLHSDKTQDIQHLLELVAYEAWHRLLFTRFLTENNLLHTDEANGSVPVSLQECDELATEMGAADGFDLACRFAQGILPGVFRSDDPALELKLSIEDSVALRKLVNSIPTEVFQADDSLGWTYQFWQDQRKEQINKSGVKIGADELSPVTQLFTEDYMVEFLLHNTLGAWWAGKQGLIQAETEDNARKEVALSEKEGVGIEWTYLRFIQNESSKAWTPAAGTFKGWPKNAKEITFLDPCMGSGHFLVFALPILARLRMEEEGLGIQEALQATLKNNIHGLELDERCSQIAACNLALTIWKLGGFQPLTAIHLACSGIAPHATQEEWAALAGSDTNLKNTMERLHKLFQNAPVLGSLINPKLNTDDMFDADFSAIQPILEKALANRTEDTDQASLGVVAQGVAAAASLLARNYTLVATNVPYLGRGKQDDLLKEYIEAHYENAKADLATVFVQRCLELCQAGGSTALVTPQNWLFLTSYKKLREELLKERQWDFIARLGEHAFESPAAAGAFGALVIISADFPVNQHTMAGLDVSAPRGQAPIYAPEKADRLANRLPTPVQVVGQAGQLGNPDARVIFGDLQKFNLLANYADSYQGIGTSDNAQFLTCFWEHPFIGCEYCYVQVAPDTVGYVSGATSVLLWEDGKGRYYQHAMRLKSEGRLGGWKSGGEAWGKSGIAVSVTGSPTISIYLGTMFDTTLAAIIPKDPKDLAAINEFLRWDGYIPLVRESDQALSITERSLLKVPFDLAHWQVVAGEKHPDGLPRLFSINPTQWLFNGHPKGADQPLHVAVARLLGYQWPRQTGSSFPDCPALGPDGLEAQADSDGIVCLSSIHREQPAAYRLRQLLASALDTYEEKQLIQQAGLKGSKASNLEDWLRDEFFEQHCALFHHRPFIWHLWDGRKDGFHALVNYHKLDHATLKKLTFTYLGEWITLQENDVKADKPGAAERLGAAKFLQQQLEAILEGEAPLDIFVRWKPLNQQAIGWHPDLNDGVRLNIRPFLLAEDVGKKGAGILRAKPNIKWDKDRGKEPERPKTEYPWFWIEEEPEEVDPAPGSEFTGNRWNNVHLSLEAKRKAQG